MNEFAAGVFFDAAAEETVLSAALDNPHLVRPVAELDPGVFWVPAAQELHAVIRSLLADGEPVDHVSVARRAAARASGPNSAQAASQRIIGLMGKTVGAVIGFHLERLKGLQQARAVQEVAVRLQQMTTQATQIDDVEMLRQAVGTAVDDLMLLRAIESGAVTDDDMPPSLSDILADRETHDWLVPGLFERTDRLILTGFEGTGKSFLLAQMALCIAAGINPFLGFPSHEPSRVLVIDCENSRRQTQRRYRRIAQEVEKLTVSNNMAAPDWSKQMRFVIRPEGVALNEPRQVQRIERNIRAVNPDLVIVGPLYRMHTLDTKDEQAAKELTNVLDHLRIKHKFCLIAEAHVSHGSTREARALRPTGSSLFLRWPEFGMGLRPSPGTEDEEHPSKVDMVSWRGGREERVWPKNLTHNYRGLPWKADDKYWHRCEQAGVKVAGGFL